MDDLRIALEADDERQIVAVCGEIDIATAPQLRAALTSVCGSGAQDIVLDLREVTFLDSVGLRELIRAVDTCDEHAAKLSLVTSPTVERLLEVTGLVSALPLQG
ncbi:MAG TPA: STAS domain-containing protein [Solirubrobacteraceae bacterium]|jgi:anti-sigma B factor antagonist|nr:STAS domain-containing protein [Solirubrobacteraceae bacterium]